jgi:hypothetical protein
MMLALLALALGIGGAAHCAAMCGGVVSVVSAGATRVRYLLAYNAGRILSYGVIGALAGASGEHAIGPFGDLRAGLRFVAALAVVMIGLRMLGVDLVTRLEGVLSPLFKILRPIGARLLGVRTIPSALALGALWGWLPCGMVYAAATLALASGSGLKGGLVMLAFGAGTLPVMLAISTFATRIARIMQRTWPRRLAGAALILSAMISISSAFVAFDDDAKASPVCVH